MGDSHRADSRPQFLVFPPETGTNYCTLIRTVDGDSVHLGLVIDISTRLYGIDTPERGQEGFKEATDRLQYLLSQNEYVRVEWRGRGKYGRYLATLYTNDETEVSINEMLVNEGHAKVYLP
jgi:micrococcal nuclease